MSMQELPDDQLDGLFRKSLGESEPPYDPSAWQAMQAILTANDRHRFWQRWLRRGLPVVLLILLPVSVWLLSNRQSADRVHAPKPVVNTKTGTSVQPAYGTEKADIREPVQAIKSVAATPEPPKSGRPSVAAVTDPVMRSRRSASGPLVADAVTAGSSAPLRGETAMTQRTGMAAGKKSFTANRPAGFTRRNTPLSDGVLARSARFSMASYARNAEPTFTEQPSVSVNGGANDPGETPAEAITGPARFQLTVSPLGTPVPALIENRLRPDRPVTAPASEPVATPKPGISSDRMTGLSIRAVVAPDLSTIGLTNFSRPGTNAGLMLEYQYQRWRIQAGVLRSIKVYRAGESMYENQSTGQWAVVPSSIGGRCNMLDIPINLRYDLALLPRRNALPPSRWFVSGGTTTYYMLKEDYTYNYDNPADPRIKYRDWSVETGRYGFSQLNVSAGYERAVTQRLFWQVEPFLKVPLKGVGYYKVNLLSTGAFISLRYRL